MSAAARAIALVGARFRLHGRDAATGLDCVGVAAIAAGVDAPTGYAARGGDAARWARAIEARGAERVDEARPGDVALVDAGAGQFHLAVMTEAGFVHADARLRRVVERPGPLPWPLIGLWRMREEG